MEVLTVSELQDICRRRGLLTTGKKEVLIERLVLAHIAANDSSRPTPSSAAATTPDDASSGLRATNYDAMTVTQLKDLCRQRSLSIGGIKKDIVARLKERDLSEAAPGASHRRATAVEASASTGGRSTPSRFSLLKFVNQVEKRKAIERTLVTVSGSAAQAMITTTPKPPSKERALPKHSSQKGAVREPVVSSSHISAAKSSSTGAAGKKRKISSASISTTDVSAAPSKVRKVPEIPTARPAKKMAQLSQAQYLTKQKPAVKTLQQFLNSLTATPSSAKEPSLEEYLSARKTAKASSALSPKPNVLIVYTTKPASPCELVKAFTSVSAANARVRQEFYENHPHGGGSDEDIARLSVAVDVTYENELLTMATRPPHNTWKVGAVAVAVDSAKVSTAEGCFVVCSHRSNTTEGPGSTPTPTFHRVFAKKNSANAYATTVFDKKSPRNLMRDELGRQRRVARRIHGGMLSLSRKASKGAVLTVSVMAVEGVSTSQVPQQLKPVTMSSSKQSAPSPTTSSKPPARTLSTQELSFVVYSSNIFREERRGKRKEAEYEFYAPVKTEKEANALAEAVFYKLNPWGWTERQFADKGVEKTVDVYGHLKMIVLDTDTWEVCVAAVSTSASAREADLASGILVYTVCGNEWSTLQEPLDPRVKVETILQPYEVNGSRMEELFCEFNPYGWNRGHFQDAKTTKTFEDGMFTVSRRPASNAWWGMKCTAFTYKTVPESTTEDRATPLPAALETRVKIES